MRRSAVRQALAAVEVDEVSRLARAPADMVVAVLERELMARGLTLGPLARREPAARIGELLQDAGARHRSPGVGRLLDACVGLEATLRDGSRVVWRPSPRKAVGPDWRSLVLGRRASPATLVAVTLAVQAAPEVSRTCAFALSDRKAALVVARDAARKDLRPASWWVTGRTLCALLEGPAALVEFEQQTLAALVETAGGRPAEPTPCPGGAARFAPWSALLRARAAASQLTLDGGCLHDRADAPVALPVRLRRALRAARIGT